MISFVCKNATISKENPQTPPFYSSLKSLTPNDGQKDDTCLPQDEHGIQNRQRQLPEAQRASNDVARVHPDGHKGDVEEVVRQHQGPLDDAGEKAGRAVGPAAAEVLEAAHLQGAQLAVVCGEERVQRLGERVDDAGEVLAAPVQFVHGLADGLCVVEVGHAVRVQQLGQQHGVVEGHRHAAARQGVPHVEGIAEHDEPVGRLGHCGEPAIGHAARDLAVGEGLFGRWADGLWQSRDGVLLDVAAHAAGLDRRLGDVLGHVEERSGLVGADLVQQDGIGVADDDMAMQGLGQNRVDQLEGVELALDDGLRLEHLLAELGVVAVGHDGQLAEEIVVLLLVGLLVDRGARLHAQDLVLELAPDRLDDLGLDHCDVLVPQAGLSQLCDELAVVESASLLLRALCPSSAPGVCDLALVVESGVGNGARLSVIEDVVAVAGDGVDALDAVAQAQLLERSHSARLQKFAHDAIRLVHPPLQQKHGAALVGERIGGRAAKDAGTDDDDVCFMVAIAPLARVDV